MAIEEGTIQGPRLMIARAAISQTFQAEQFLVLTAVLYLLLAAGFSSILRWTERRLASRPPRNTGIQGARTAYG